MAEKGGREMAWKRFSDEDMLKMAWKRFSDEDMLKLLRAIGLKL